MWGAIAGAAIGAITSSNSASKSRKEARRNAEQRDKYLAEYEGYLDELEGVQKERNAVIDASNVVTAAQARRDTSRVARQQAANAEASAYLSGVSGGSGLQGFLGSLSMDTATSLRDVSYSLSSTRYNSELDQEQSTIQRKADKASGLANQYGAAVTQAKSAAARSTASMWGSIGSIAGSVAGKIF